MKLFLKLLIGAVAASLFIGLQSTPAAAQEGSSCPAVTFSGFSVPGSSISLEADQVRNARLLMGVARDLGISPRDRASEIAIMASLQAKSLRSPGLFNQQPQFFPGINVTDDVDSARAFYRDLVGVGSWQFISRSTVASRVQGVSGTASFARWETTARALVDEFGSSSLNPGLCAAGETVVAPSASSPGVSSSPSTTTSSSLPRITDSPIPGQSVVGGITVADRIAGNVQRLLAAAAADGINLRGSGFRSPEIQIALRRQNCGTSQFDIFIKSSSLCSPPTARPGTSNHETGLAIDFRNCSTRSTACFRWLDANASRFGLFNFPPEPWHWSVNGR